MSVIKSVQSGTFAWSSNATYDLTVTAVVTANSIVTFNYDTATTTNMVARGQVTSELSSTTNIRFTKYEAGDTINVKWFLIEYDSGVTVQRGSVLVSDNLTHDITISTVVTANTYVIVDYRSAGNSYDFGDTFTGNLTTTTNLQVAGAGSGATTGATICWQVIQDTSASVQLITKALGNTTTDTSTITSVTTTKTLLIGGGRWGALAPVASHQYFWGFKLTDSTTISYFRSAAQDITWNMLMYVISYSDDSTVQRGEVSVGAGTTTSTVSITSVDTTKSAAFTCAQYQRTVSCANTAGGAPGENTFSTYFSSATQITWARGTSTYAATYEWEVTENLTGAAAAKERVSVIWIPWM